MNPHAAELILRHAASLLDESEFIEDPGGRGEVVFAVGEIVKSVVDSLGRRRSREYETRTDILNRGTGDRTKGAGGA